MKTYIQIRRCVFYPNLKNKKFQSLHPSALDKNAHLLICISVFITKVILISRETDDRRHLSREGRYTLFRYIFRYTDWINSATRQKIWKLISPHANCLPTIITPAKKDWNCSRLRRAEHLSPQYPTLSEHYLTFIIKLIPLQTLKSVIKADLNIKNFLFLKNNCRNIWIIQIKVVTLYHQNNNSNNN